MAMAKVYFGVLCALALLAATACSDSSNRNRHIDIGRVFAVKSSFAADYKVVTSGPTDIDPRLLTPQKLSPDMTVDPADCAGYASGQTLPRGLKGRMATVSAEGNSSRFTVVAIEASQPVPYQPISDHCKHITFTGRSVKGVIDVIDAPHIDAAQSLATHRVLEAALGGQNHSGDVYNYTAYLGKYLVLVAANSLSVPGQPPVLVDVDKPRRLLTDSVAAVRG